MAGGAESLSTLQYAGAAAGPAPQQAGPRAPPGTPPRRREHRIAPPPGDCPAAGPGHLETTKALRHQHAGTGQDTGSRARSPQHFSGGHDPTGPSGTAPHPQNLPLLNWAGIKGLTHEPRLDSSPRAEEGTGGPPAHRPSSSTSLLQHHVHREAARGATERYQVTPGHPTASRCLPSPAAPHTPPLPPPQVMPKAQRRPWSITAGPSPVS